jgi:transglutaminase-like putative cysteine protease
MEAETLKKYLKILPVFILYAVLPVFIANAAIITTTDGTATEITNIDYKENTLKGIVKGNLQPQETVIGRDRIKSISFSGKKQDKKIENSDSEDLPLFMEKAEKMLQTHPDARYLVVHEESNYVHRANGTNISRFRNVVYIAKEEALWNAHQSISFDPDRESVKVIHARSYGPDKSVNNLKETEIKIEKATSGSVYFSKDKTMSFTVPEVTVGYLVDCSYEVEEFNPFDRNLFQGRSYFKWAAPVGTSVLRVSVPTGKQLYHINKNTPADFEPEIIEAIDSKVYTWKMSDLDPIISEPYMPSYRDVVPCVYFSLHKDYTYMNNKLRPMFEKRFQLTDAVKQKVDELTKGAKDVVEKISRLYLFCQKEIRYISIKSNLASNQVGHPAEETLKNRYGDCTDKGMLLATMLKHIGVEAYPVVIRTNNAGKAVREIAIFDDNHCITEIHLDGRVFYLDSTATDYRYPYFRSDDHDTVAKNAMLGTVRNVPLPPPEDNAVITKRNIVLMPDGSTEIEIKTTQNGSAESGMRGLTRSLKPEEYEKSIRSSIAAITADYDLQVATFSDPLDFSVQFNTRTKYTLNRYAPKSGKYMIFAVPNFEMRFAEVSLEKRKFDIEYRTSALRTEHIDIKLPKGYMVKYLPPALRVQSPYIEFEIIYDQQGEDIEITRKLAILKRTVPVEDYDSYKKDLEKIAFSGKQKIFLEEVAGKEKSDGGDL